MHADLLRNINKRNQNGDEKEYGFKTGDQNF